MAKVFKRSVPEYTVELTRDDMWAVISGLEKYIEYLGRPLGPKSISRHLYSQLVDAHYDDNPERAAELKARYLTDEV